MRSRLILLATGIPLSAFGMAALLVANGLDDQLGRADVALVLGNAVYPDGRPSDRLRARLDKTAELYRKGLFEHILVSGGIFHPSAPEGTAMKAYLAGKGIPEGAILVDNAGVDTRASARNTAALLRKRNWSSVLAITQYFHIPRTRLALRQEGIPTIRTAHAGSFEKRDLSSITRELAGYAAYFFRLK